MIQEVCRIRSSIQCITPDQSGAWVSLRTPAEWAKHEKKRHHSAFLTSYVGGTFVPGRVDAAGTYHYIPEKEKKRV